MKRLILFTANDCENCNNIKQILDEISAAYEQVGMERNLNTCLVYGVRTAPTLLMLDEHNEEVKRLEGEVLTSSDLTIWLNKTP